MCYCYILFSKNLDKFYVGSTCDKVDSRLLKHLSNHKGYTSRTKDWEVVYIESFDDRSCAYQRELQIKSWKSKAKILKLISES